MLTLYIDFKSAAAYLAMLPSCALAQRKGVSIAWRPFRTRSWQLPIVTPNETVGQSHRRVRAQAQRATFLKYAALQGLEMKIPHASGETDLALGVLTQIDGDPLPFITACFSAYWVDGLDLNAEETVQALLTQSGVGHSGDMAAARDALSGAQIEAEAIGIVDTPAYYIADQLFIGREHLPWIERLL